MAHGWLRYPLAVKWLRKLCERWNVQQAETYRNEIAWNGWYKMVQVCTSTLIPSPHIYQCLVAEPAGSSHNFMNFTAPYTTSNSYDRSFLPASWFFLHWLLTRGLMTIESTGLKQWNTLGHRVVTEFSALNFHQIDHRFSQLLTPCQEPRCRPGCNHTKRCAECGLKISESCASLLRNKMLRVVCGKHIATEGKAFVVRFFLVLDARAAVAAAEASKIVQLQRPAGKYHHSPP